MEIFFTDPSEVPLPSSEVRIRVLRAAPLDDRRVRIYLEVDPFQQRPSVELTISNATNDLLATSSIIESTTRKMEIIMHLRSAQPGNECSLRAELFFSTLPEPQPNQIPGPIQRQDVDQVTTTFTLPIH